MSSIFSDVDSNVLNGLTLTIPLTQLKFIDPSKYSYPLTREINNI